MKAARSILVVTHQFDDRGGRRVDKLVKHLSRLNLRVHVLTGVHHKRNQGINSPWPGVTISEVRVPKLLNQPFTRALHVVGRPPAGTLWLDEWLGLNTGPWWLWALWREAKRLHRNTPFSCVLTSSPPESAHWLGWALSRRYGVWWVADFRDLWTAYPDRYAPPTPIHAWWARRCERTFYRNADRVVANTPNNATWIAAWADIVPEKINVITNGYDPEDFADDAAAQDDALTPTITRIGFLGAFEKSHHFPAVAFMEALHDARKRGAQLELHIWGQAAPSRSLARALRELEMEDVVSFNAPLDHHDALRAARSSHVMLVFMSDDRPEHAAVVPQKLYQYLGMRRPILGCLPLDGFAAEIIRNCGAGWVVKPVRTDMADALVAVDQDLRNGATRPASSAAALVPYQWPTLASTLAPLMDRESMAT